NDSRLRFGPAIFNRTAERGHVFKLGALSQKTGDFDVRVHAVFEFPVKLEKKFVGEEHRRVALLTAENIGRRNNRDFGYARTERADQIAIPPAGMLSIQHEAKKFLSKIYVPNSVKKNRVV